MAVRQLRFQCRSLVRAPIRLMASTSSTRKSFAISDPKSDTAAARRTISRFSTSLRTPQRQSPRVRAQSVTRCGSATRCTYNSDQDGTFNLYAYDVASGNTTQLTHSTTWDVRWPSADRGNRQDRLREGGRADHSRHANRRRARRSCHRRRRRAEHSALTRIGGRPDRGRGAESQGRARAVCGSRRHLHCACRARLYAEPHAFFQRTRPNATGRRTARASHSSPI